VGNLFFSFRFKGKKHVVPFIQSRIKGRAGHAE
jgi:hypothetical protein